MSQGSLFNTPVANKVAGAASAEESPSDWSESSAALIISKPLGWRSSIQRAAPSDQHEMVLCELQGAWFALLPDGCAERRDESKLSHPAQFARHLSFSC
jgi:hypothetical protein